MMAATMAIARLSWKRMWRGKSIWITGILLLVPIVLAALAAAGVPDAGERWSIVAEVSLRSLVLLAPVLHLAPAVGEESEGKTYTYLWSHPIPRPALLFGKILATTPLLGALAAAALGIAFGICAAGPGGADVAWLAPALLAAVLGVVGASAFAVGIGALFPKHPLVLAFGYIFLVEQVLPEIGSLQNLSTLYHVEVIARTPHSLVHGGSVGGSVIALVVLSAIWLAVGVWRVNVIEFGSADG